MHHSATKYLSGHGDVTAGVLVGSRELIEVARAQAVRIGLNLGPFDAWLTLRGVRTLALRMERHSSNALELARFLRRQSAGGAGALPGAAGPPAARTRAGAASQRVRWHAVLRAGGRSFGDPAVLCARWPARSGSPGREALIAFAPSFGDVTTTWSYPARTSHRALSDDERAKLGIGAGLVRLSVGIEDVEDLKESLDLALRAAGS